MSVIELKSSHTACRKAELKEISEEQAYIYEQAFKDGATWMLNEATYAFSKIVYDSEDKRMKFARELRLKIKKGLL